MVVTKPRPVQLTVSRPRTRHLVTILSPDAGPSRWRCEPAMWTVVVGGRERGRCIHHCQLLYLRPALRHLSPLPPDAPTMATVTPPQIPVPPFLEPLLSYITSCLPPPVYSALLTLLTHGLAFFSALIGLGSALI